MRKPLVTLSMLVAAVIGPLAQSVESRIEASVAGRADVRIDSGRPRWPIGREASGQWGVVGEAVATNTGSSSIEIRSVSFSVMDRYGRRLFEEIFDSRDLVEAIVRVRRPLSGQELWQPTSVLNPGEVGVAFLAGLIDPGLAPAVAQVTLSFTTGQAKGFAVPLDVFSPGQRMALPVRLDSEPWLALNTAGTAHHWIGSAFVQDRQLFVGQRFAIDLLQIDAGGQTHPASTTDKESYYAWGEEILSTGRGRVVAVVSDQHDLEIGELPSSPFSAGNHVVVRHAPRVFSVYAHMQQGSAIVNVGDWVERGQVLGLVGNSGNTTEPHLHLHFADAWPPSSNPEQSLASGQGLPALFWGGFVVRDDGLFRLNGSTPLESDVIVGAGGNW